MQNRGARLQQICHAVPAVLPLIEFEALALNQHENRLCIFALRGTYLGMGSMSMLESIPHNVILGISWKTEILYTGVQALQ